MHFFSAQQDWNSERLEFGGCLIITSSHHEGTIRYHLAHQASGAGVPGACKLKFLPVQSSSKLYIGSRHTKFQTFAAILPYCQSSCTPNSLYDPAGIIYLYTKRFYN
jgi:hypothetical protein